LPPFISVDLIFVGDRDSAIGRDKQRGDFAVSRAASPDTIFPFGQQIALRLNVGADRLLKATVTLTARQLELSHGLLQGGAEDLALLGQVRTLEELLQAQSDIIRRQSDRTLQAIQAMAQQLTQSMSETAQFLWRVNA